MISFKREWEHMRLTKMRLLLGLKIIPVAATKHRDEKRERDPEWCEE